MYTKEELKSKSRQDLVKIAKEVKVFAGGKSTVIIEKILEKEKPTFDALLNDAPVSKDAEMTVEVIEKEKEETEEVETTNIEETEEVTPPGNEKDEVEPGDKPKIVAENKALDILNYWSGSIQAFYSKNVNRRAPTRPNSTKEIAEQLGIPVAIPMLDAWKNSFINKLRPQKGFAPTPPLSSRQILTKMKNELPIN